MEMHSGTVWGLEAWHPGLGRGAVPSPGLQERTLLGLFHFPWLPAGPGNAYRSVTPVPA